MTINAKDTLCNKNKTKSLCSTNISNCTNVHYITPTKYSTTGAGKCSKSLKANSPYLAGDKGQFSRVMEKRFVHKQGSDFLSSFPLAAHIYKANSDEFRLTKRTNKAAKKSVLTLPNERLVRPETCTVSDMNDSEYFNREDENRKQKTRRRLSSQNNRRPHFRNKDEFEFYDRDARYCSQMDIHLDCSSSDLVKDFNGDVKRHPKKSLFTRSPRTERNVNPRDVWTILRNINQFQFRPSPPISEDNVASSKKNRLLNKKRKRRKDTRVVETCRTEEFAYISNFEVTSKSPTDFSRSSSVDRITVINKDAEFTELCKEFETRVSKTQKFIKGAANAKALNRIKNTSTKNKTSVKNNSSVKENEVSSDLNPLILFIQPDANVINIKKNIEGCKENNNQLEPSFYAKSGASFDRNIKSYNSDQLSAIKTGDQIKENCKLNKVNPYGDCNETLYSGCSGSSKAGLQNFVTNNSNKKNKVKLPKVSSDECNQENKGTIQVVFNKPRDVITPNRDISNRKPWLVTTVRRAAVTPKLTQTEIRRKLANVKFPLVILGKDELTSSSIQVEPFDAIQFNGLDKHVWPFMVNWYEYKIYTDGENISNIENKAENGRILAEPNKIHGDSVSTNLTKQGITKNRKSQNNYKFTCKKKNLKENIENNDNQYWQDRKPIRQFKDKVLQLLYKKTSTGNIILHDNDDDNVDKKDDIKKQKHIIMPKNFELLDHACKKDASTETYNKFCQHPDILIGRLNLNSPSVRSRKIPIVRHPWCKVKWASDIIENVIKKIKCGIYYNEENRGANNKYSPDILKDRLNLNSPSVRSRKIPIERHPWGKVKGASDIIENVIQKIKCGIYYNEERRGVDKRHYPAWREASTQTNLSMGRKSFDDDIGEDSKLIPKVIVDIKRDPPKMIPGFDEALQAVEIKTMNVKQIAVKHCLTNIIVEFDVAIPTQLKCITMNPEEAFSLVPIAQANSQTKIFKCKTTILNPILPAELCCLLPKMIHSVIEFNASKHLSLLPILAKENKTQLSTNSKLLPTHMDKFPLISHIKISRYSVRLTQGTFPVAIKNKSTVKKRALLMKYSRLDILYNIVVSTIDVIPFTLPFSVKADPTVIKSEQEYNVLPGQKAHNCTAIQYNVLPGQKADNCTAIQSYAASKKSLIPTVIANTYMNILQKIWRNETAKQLIFSNYPEYTNNIQITAFNKPCKIDNNVTQKIVSLSVGTLKINSLFNDFMNPSDMMISKLSENKVVSSLKLRRIENVKPHKIEKSCFLNLGLNNTKSKKKYFVRLYKKCKSTTSISTERASTSLNKIINIEDFCQALGSGKLISSVFEGYAEKKILMALVQMKNWVTEISQRQAMLVLLLSNKKDTRNLVRFRPILLQGIAVNRITRASELDMEIEVIERENVNKRPQYEGISYVTSSEQTKDNLLEELYWIAKTTASDYQKPFDESSERLLKSLLEKRKKLNPSYLRVMARYVGLGLLKPPSKFN